MREFDRHFTKVAEAQKAEFALRERETPVSLLQKRLATGTWI
jgi:hypothetical protein